MSRGCRSKCDSQDKDYGKSAHNCADLKIRELLTNDDVRKKWILSLGKNNHIRMQYLHFLQY